MKDKLNVLFTVSANNNWIGGVYYIRNMIYSLLTYPKSKEKINIYIFVSTENAQAFSECLQEKNVFVIYQRENRIWKTIGKNVFKLLLKREMASPTLGNLFKIVIQYHINVIYPLPNSRLYSGLLKKKGISWIPDFQHVYLPEYFSKEEINKRNKSYESIALNHHKLILSSYSAYKNYKSLFPKCTNNVYVVPFSSMINPQIISIDKIDQTLDNFGISDKFFMVSNQFWQHKNYMTLFKAVQEIINVRKEKIFVVCTGLFNDYRNPEYINELEAYLDKFNLRSYIKILGLIEREEQIQLMKCCIAVIQPSLFEGWGTVVEDAKTLKKKIILSDIDVHYEQKNSDCLFFYRYNYMQLADLMLECWGDYKPREFGYDISSAQKYGKLFYEVLTS